MTDLRNKIEACVERAILDGGFGEKEATDAILALVRESVPPLDWRKGDRVNAPTAHCSYGAYTVYKCSGKLEGKYNPCLNGRGIAPNAKKVCDTFEEAIGVVNAHHLQTILKSMGLADIRAEPGPDPIRPST